LKEKKIKKKMTHNNGNDDNNMNDLVNYLINTIEKEKEKEKEKKKRTTAKQQLLLPLTDLTESKIIVIFKPTLAGSPLDFCQKFKSNIGIIPDHIYHSVTRGFASSVSESKLRFLANDETILRIERDHILHRWGVFTSFSSHFLTMNKNKNKNKNKNNKNHKNDESLSSSTIPSSLPPNNNSNFLPKGWHIDSIRKKLDLMELKNAQSKQFPVHLFVFDTGISMTHPDLNILKINRRNFVTDPDEINNDDDLLGHSSHVAGIAASLNKTGRGIYGVAPGIQLHSFKVLDHEGNGNMSYVLAGIEFLTQEKMKYPHVPMVANLSLGFDSKSNVYNVLDEAIERAIKVGIVFVIAAGNDAVNMDTYSPAHVKSAIVVSAYGLNKSNGKPEFAREFANFGQIDLLAPGVDIYSTWKNKEYKIESGTSMATPHVSAAACLYLCAQPQATADEVKYFLLNSAKVNQVLNVPENTPNVALHIPDSILQFVYSSSLLN
jgi:subtilisin family serine protease